MRDFSLVGLIASWVVGCLVPASLAQTSDSREKETLRRHKWMGLETNSLWSDGKHESYVSGSESTITAIQWSTNTNWGSVTPTHSTVAVTVPLRFDSTASAGSNTFNLSPELLTTARSWTSSPQPVAGLPTRPFSSPSTLIAMPRPTRREVVQPVLIANTPAPVPLPGGVGVGHFVSSIAGPDAFSGVDINTRVGANTFYSNSFSGTSAIVANIEAGHVWDLHETLGHVAQFISGPGTPGAISGHAAAYDRHATWCGQALGGRVQTGGGEWQRGIAHGATLWSGAIATSWTGSPYSLSFTFATYAAMITPYRTAATTGISGQRADVINSSWGFAGDSVGRDATTMGIDSVARESNKVFVISAGNNGPGLNTVNGPATGYNVISVAALGSDTSVPTYDTVSTFSSRGPNHAFTPTAAIGFGTGSGTTTLNARIRVDIAAPGQNLTLAFYGGTTGGNTGGTNVPGTNLYSTNIQGTSFAAPTVAGGIGLMIDAARTNSLSNGTDPRVIKAILLTTADKTAGWSNAQAPISGVITTTQALDPDVGAGRMNLTAAYPFVSSPSAGTQDVPGFGSGSLGTVNQFGYDLGRVNRTGTTNNDYTISGFFDIGSTAVVTLNWYARRTLDAGLTTLTDDGLSNLNLQIWRVVGGIFTELKAESRSVFNNTEHLAVTLDTAGNYGIRVVYFGDNWRFDGNTNDTYGLAWNFVPIPEPGWLLLFGLILLRSRQAN